jgi:hypothetical protein
MSHNRGMGQLHHRMDGRRAHGRYRQPDKRKPPRTPNHRCRHAECMAAFAAAMKQVRKEFSQCGLGDKLVSEVQYWMGRLFAHDISRPRAPKSLPRHDIQLLVLRIFAEACDAFEVRDVGGYRLDDFKVARQRMLAKPARTIRVSTRAQRRLAPATA